MNFDTRNENDTRPSSWLRMHQLRMLVDMCSDVGATEDFYMLPVLPKELLDRLDSIEPEHLGPIAEECGEMTHDFDAADEALAHYASAPHCQYVELQRHRFVKTGTYEGGVGFLHLYESATKPNVMYLLESDGESGAWCGMRFGHYD